MRENKPAGGLGVWTTLGRGLVLGALIAGTTGLARAQEGGNALQLDATIEPTQLQVGEDLTLRLAIVGDPQACDPVVTRRPLDIALVVDASGSMDESLGAGVPGSKLDAAIGAIAQFFEQMSPTQDRVAVVVYGDAAETVKDLDFQTATATDLERIRQSSARGGTNIESGIRAATELLESQGRLDASRVIVVLSDGQQNQGDAEAAGQAAKDLGLQMVSIGLGPSVDDGLLRAMASETADYYYAPSSEDLDRIYAAIAESIQIYDPATDVIITYTFDASNFELDTASVTPPAEVSVNRVTWTLPRLERGHEDVSLRLRARVPGQYDAALSGHLSYLSCGQVPVDSDLPNRVPVEVLSTGLAAEPVCVAAPAAVGGLALDSLCQFPWGWVVGLVVALAGLLWWLTRNWFDLKSWRVCGLPLDSRVWWQWPLILALAGLAGALAQTLATQACTPSQALTYWQVAPDRTTALLLKSTVPELAPRRIGNGGPTSECIGCHTQNPVDGTWVGVSQGTNGLLVQLGADGAVMRDLGLQGSYPAWSPDGRLLAYAANGEDIYLYDPETGQSQPLVGASEPGAVETMPAWEPDGSRLAFVRATGTGAAALTSQPSDIMTVAAIGGSATLLPGASGSGYNYHPAFSPDGRWLAFTRHTTGSTNYGDPAAEIYVVPSEGGSPRRLAANDGPGAQLIAGAGNTWPTWSADSHQIFFSSRRCNDLYELYTTTLDDNGNSGPALRLATLSAPGAFSYHLQPATIVSGPWWSRWLGLWPWLLATLLSLGALAFVHRQRFMPGRPLDHTLALQGDVQPDVGRLVPTQHYTVNLELLPQGACESQASSRPTDVVLLVDTSLSMTDGFALGQNKIHAARRAAQRFVNCVIGPRERVAVVRFDSSAEVRENLTNDTKALARALSLLDAKGEGTQLDLGLAEARKILTGSGRPQSQKVIVLLSDGQPSNDAQLSVREAEAIRRDGIRIMAVAVGNIPEPLLRDMAGDTGSYTYVRDARGLQAEFLKVGRSLRIAARATQVVVEHHIDATRFQIVRESVEPAQQADIQPDGLIWHLDEVNEAPISLRYAVRPLVAGNDLPIDLGTVVSYRRCGAGRPMSLSQAGLTQVSVREVWRPPQRPLPVYQPAEVRRPQEVWQPDQALFVGVGGTGRWVLTHLKKNLLDAGCGVLPAGLRFLLVDTSEYERLNGQRVDVQLEGVEIGPEDVFVMDEDLSAVEPAHWTRPEYRGWFDRASFGANPAALNLANGSGSERVPLRAAFLRNLRREAGVSPWQMRQRAHDQSVWLQEWVQERVKEALRVDDVVRRVRIFVVGSTAGGMSGILADVAALVRAEASHTVTPVPTVSVEAYLLDSENFASLPGDPQAVDIRRANSRVTWQELSRVQLIAGQPVDLGWKVDSQGVVNQRLFDDLLVFSGDLNRGVDDLQTYLYPVVADLITARLDRGLGVIGGAADYYAQMRTATATIEAQRGQMAAGTAGTFAYRIPVADILRSLQVEWEADLVRAFLCSQADAAVPEAKVIPTGYPEQPELCLEGFLEWGPLGQGAPTESHVLIAALRKEGPVADGLPAILVPQVIEATALEQFAQFVLSILLRADEPVAPDSYLGRLRYAQAMLDHAQKAFTTLLQEPSLAADVRAIASAYLKAAHRVRGSIEQLWDATTAPAAGSHSGGLLTQLDQARRATHAPRAAHSSRARRYLETERQADALGQVHERAYRDLWRSAIFQQEHTEAVRRCLRWHTAPTGLDLAVELDATHRVYLLGDGLGQFLAALRQVTQQMGDQAWAELNLADVLTGHGVLSDFQQGQAARLASLPHCETGPQTPLAPSISVLTTAALAPHVVGTPFSAGVFENPAGGRVAVMPLDAVGTDPSTLLILQQQSGLIIENLPGTLNATRAYARLEGDDAQARQLNRRRQVNARWVYRPEAEAWEVTRGLPRRAEVDSHMRPLHAHVIAGLQSVQRAENFIYALAQDWLTFGQAPVRLQIPDGAAVTFAPAQGAMASEVDAWLQWTLGPTPAMSAAHAVLSAQLDAALGSHQTLVDLQMTLTQRIQRPQSVVVTDLYHLARAVVAHWLRTHTRRWVE